VVLEADETVVALIAEGTVPDHDDLDPPDIVIRTPPQNLLQIRFDITDVNPTNFSRPCRL
jgi:hypothetical protein